MAGVVGVTLVDCCRRVAGVPGLQLLATTVASSLSSLASSSARAAKGLLFSVRHWWTSGMRHIVAGAVVLRKVEGTLGGAEPVAVREGVAATLGGAAAATCGEGDSGAGGICVGPFKIAVSCWIARMCHVSGRLWWE
jgi:hypothetical protein